jgi:hypothetical protein
MWCSVDHRNIERSELMASPEFGTIHENAEGWHTVRGTLLDGDPPNLAIRHGISSPAAPMAPPAGPDGALAAPAVAAEEE